MEKGGAESRVQEEPQRQGVARQGGHAKRNGGGLSGVECGRGGPATDIYARERGLYVLKLSGEDTFTMAPPRKPKTF